MRYSNEGKVWVVVETYYEHGECNHTFFKIKNELTSYILETLWEYEVTGSNLATKLLNDLINLVVEIGDIRVAEKMCFGVRELQEFVKERTFTL
jgi:hypothetical protein